MGGVAVNDLRKGCTVGRTILSRHEDNGVGTASAGELERVSLVSLVCLGRL